jgi:hypothetical protein
MRQQRDATDYARTANSATKGIWQEGCQHVGPHVSTTLHVSRPTAMPMASRQSARAGHASCEPNSGNSHQVILVWHKVLSILTPWRRSSSSTALQKGHLGALNMTTGVTAVLKSHPLLRDPSALTSLLWFRQNACRAPLTVAAAHSTYLRLNAMMCPSAAKLSTFVQPSGRTCSQQHVVQSNSQLQILLLLLYYCEYYCDY